MGIGDPFAMFILLRARSLVSSQCALPHPPAQGRLDRQSHDSQFHSAVHSALVDPGEATAKIRRSAHEMQSRIPRQILIAFVPALFSKHLASPQPDWPAHTVQPGFVFYDRPEMDSELRNALESFIAKSDAPPIVFSLGSTAAHNPGQFYEVSISATKRLGRSAVLVGAGGAPTVIEPGTWPCLTRPTPGFFRVLRRSCTRAARAQPASQ